MSGKIGTDGQLENHECYLPSNIKFLMKFKFERIILKSLTSGYSNAYHSCSMMVRFKLQRCTIYESVAGIAVVTTRRNFLYQFLL